MHLGLIRREHLESGDARLVGRATAEQFQRTHAGIGAWREVEHTDDGHHGAIHADSLDLAGDALIHGDLAVDGAVTLAGAPLGVWQDEPFDPAHFGADPPLTYAPTPAEVQWNRSTRTGATLQWAVSCLAPIGGSGTGAVTVRLPQGCVAARRGTYVGLSVFGTGIPYGSTGLVDTTAGSPVVRLVPLPAGAFTPGPATFWAALTIEVR